MKRIHLLTLLALCGFIAFFACKKKADPPATTTTTSATTSSTSTTSSQSSADVEKILGNYDVIDSSTTVPLPPNKYIMVIKRHPGDKDKVLLENIGGGGYTVYGNVSANVVILPQQTYDSAYKNSYMNGEIHFSGSKFEGTHTLGGITHGTKK